jgi:hypothetical protein
MPSRTSAMGWRLTLGASCGPLPGGRKDAPIAPPEDHRRRARATLPCLIPPGSLGARSGGVVGSALPGGEHQRRGALNNDGVLIVHGRRTVVSAQGPAVSGFDDPCWALRDGACPAGAGAPLKAQGARGARDLRPLSLPAGSLLGPPPVRPINRLSSSTRNPVEQAAGEGVAPSQTGVASAAYAVGEASGSSAGSDLASFVVARTCDPPGAGAPSRSSGRSAWPPSSRRQEHAQRSAVSAGARTNPFL